MHPINTPLKMSLVLLAFVSLFSCSKDADLLSEYVIAKDNDLQSIALLIDDSFYMAPGQNEIVMDVLNNDSFGANTQVTIVDTSIPKNGEVVINEDNTLTYSPQVQSSQEETTTASVQEPVQEDTFTYTTEVTTEDNSTYREEATVTVNPENIKAFPNAFGGGSNATGGRGRALAIVNTLDRNAKLTYYPASGNNDEYYTGGLYAAMQEEKVGYIVFNISGNIQLGLGGVGGQFGFDGIPNVNNKTIFGQSAPEGGITLTGGTFRINGRFGDGNNLIFRYLRSRPIYDRQGNKRNTNGLADDDSYTWAFLFYGGENIILSNCSASFAYDKVVGVYIDRHVAAEGNGAKNITIQDCLIADGHTNAVFGVNPNQDGNPEDLFDNISFNRNAVIGGNRTANISFNGQAEMINNLIYDPPSKMSNTYYHLILNHIANWHGRPPSNSTVSHAYQELNLNTTPIIYTMDNYYEGFEYYEDANINNKSIWVEFGNRSNSLGSSFFTDTKHSLSNIPNQLNPSTPEQVYQNMIINKNIGANKYLDNDGRVKTFQDSFDSNVLNIVSNRTEKEWHKVSEWILPAIPNNVRPSDYDTDNDGMSDAWEIREFGNLNQSYRDDFDGDGYQNIEEYMNQVDFN